MRTHYICNFVLYREMFIRKRIFCDELASNFELPCVFAFSSFYFWWSVVNEFNGLYYLHLR